MTSDFEPDTGIPWHALPLDEVYEKLSSGPEGLGDDEAAHRLQHYGPNTLPARKPPGIVAIFLHQFGSPLIFILLAAALISFALQDVRDGIFILAVVLLNAAIGLVQEWRAEQSAGLLRRLLTRTAHLRREGRHITADSAVIVPGDIVLLESGGRVPADLRLVHAAGCRIDESALTGETLAAEKDLAPVRLDAAVGDRTNMAFAGTTVVSGRAVGVVTATGLKSEVGRIAEAVAATGASKPPLLIRMERFSRTIGILVLGASALMAAVALGRGTPFTEVFFLAVALAVSAIPEGLPVAITVALSIGSSKMARRNVIVRRLAAVESLGSCTMIATDKTGTLTLNRQSVRRVILPDGTGYAVADGAVPDPASLPRLHALARTAVICNEGEIVMEEGEWVHHGDAMDVALLSFARDLGIDAGAVREAVRIIGSVAFEPELRYSAAYYRDEDGRIMVAAKGALETLLPYCLTMETGEGRVPLERSRIEAALADLASHGYRVLAVAEGEIGAVPATHLGLEEGRPPLNLLGLAGFIDPVRPDVPEALERCREAGIEVAMITGDHPETALAIGRQIGLASERGEVVTGPDLEAIGSPDLPEFFDRVRSGRIFARVSPLQKLEIVDAMVRDGHFVAVTGDGANDAPALRRANIGVAMGSGTDLAKDTASMIITDDDFSSIVAGIEEGRYAYDNIRKVTYLLISTGFAEIVLFTVALAAGLPLPLLAVQLLWLNLVTNGIQDVALAFESGEAGTMRRPPRRPNEGIFNRLMIRETMLSGFLMGAIASATYVWLIAGGADESATRSTLMLLMVLLENLHALNCRSEYRSLFRVPLRDNYYLIAGILVAQGVHIAAMTNPLMQDLLRIGPVGPATWGVLLALASGVVIGMEAFKWAMTRGRT
ncbi:cation-translocating P-type ATPase [Methanofollis fontis]|uniref:ATPase n=1 Tax=Methanofollis fontis TaxID=2052832 RepID=A0A483CS39_9EURY|nr:HAD-IC family P-type ATPase [Methanofollis fontis]TAJ43970.1 ATPase [Methanofollis fontis]